MRSERGAALVVVLLAIVVLLPPTLVLATLALRWQRQSLDFRDLVSGEFFARAAFEEARNRIASADLDLAPNQGSSFLMRRLGEPAPRVRVSREEDIVVSVNGTILDALAAQKADLSLTGTDPEGRVVYRFRKLEIYLVQVDVQRRPSLPTVRLYGVVARLPDGSLSTLGESWKRLYPDASR